MSVDDDLIRAHEHCVNNRLELAGSKSCGCIYCLKIFHPSEIAEWWDESGDTAVCPYCGIDAVLGDKFGFPVTREFLVKMRRYWFTEAE